MCNCPDNQDVGLEAAIHSKSAYQLTGLVKPACDEDVTGLKPRTEAAGKREQLSRFRNPSSGRGKGRDGGEAKRALAR